MGARVRERRAALAARAPEVEISGKARGRNTPRATGAWRCHASQRPRLAPRSPCLPARSALPLSAWHACISTRMPSVMHTISTLRSRKQRRAARPCGARSSGGDQHCALQRAIAPPHHPDAVVQTSCTSRDAPRTQSHEPRAYKWPAELAGERHRSAWSGARWPALATRRRKSASLLAPPRWRTPYPPAKPPCCAEDALALADALWAVAPAPRSLITELAHAQGRGVLYGCRDAVHGGAPVSVHVSRALRASADSDCVTAHSRIHGAQRPTPARSCGHPRRCPPLDVQVRVRQRRGGAARWTVA